MDKYNISESTALRDIISLEEIGMPIFSEYGRYGRYGILKHRLLSPINFTLLSCYAYGIIEDPFGIQIQLMFDNRLK